MELEKLILKAKEKFFKKPVCSISSKYIFGNEVEVIIS